MFRWTNVMKTLLMVGFALGQTDAVRSGLRHKNLENKFTRTGVERKGFRSDRERKPVVVFWNIFAQGKHYKSIVNEQKYMIEASGLINRVDTIYYATIGNEGQNLTLDGSKYIDLIYHGLKADETKTLAELYNYCSTHNDSKVLYFHNKGSYNYHSTNTNFRRALDCFVLNPNCIKLLDSHDTCGWRFTPLPHPHYSGNYWWATCKHINRLVDPLSFEKNETFREKTNSLYRKDLPPKKQDTFIGIDRFFGETWIGTLPMYHPADCMNFTVNTDYIMGYGIPWRLVNRICPNFKLKFNFDENSNLLKDSLPYRVKTGLPCATAALIRTPRAYSRSVQKLLADGLYRFKDELDKRSILWYGQEPLLQHQVLAQFQKKIH